LWRLSPSPRPPVCFTDGMSAAPQSHGLRALSDMELAEAVDLTLRESRRFLNQIVIRYEASVDDFTSVLRRKDCWETGRIGAGHTSLRCG
jgi:hypothetical protein